MKKLKFATHRLQSAHNTDVGRVNKIQWLQFYQSVAITADVVFKER